MHRKFRIADITHPFQVRKTMRYRSFCQLLFVLLFLGCSSELPQKTAPKSPTIAPLTWKTLGPDANTGDPMYSPDPDRISLFIRNVMQDRSGNLWLGTNGDGVCRYDGKKLEYFSDDEGFWGVAVRGMSEDSKGNLWFGTERGLNRYDGKTFTNFSTREGMPHSDVWDVIVDDKDRVWVATLEGACYFDGKKFVPFELPESTPDPDRGVTSANIVHSIMQDRAGRMWFGNNSGVFVYDGKDLKNYSVEDGVCGDCVNRILESSDGTIWIATHHNGICRFDGKSFQSVTKEDGVEGTEGWGLYEDRSGNVWFTLEHSGVYRYDGEKFTQIHRDQGLACNAVQCVYEDKERRLWIGGVFGLFRCVGDQVYPVGKSGPWGVLGE